MIVDDACAGLAEALPIAAALTPQPDRDGTTTRGKPGSKPPWNTEAANALFDALEGVRRLNTSLHYAVHGTPGPHRSYAQTGATLRDIANIAAGLNADGQELAAKYLARLRSPIDQLPAVDQQAKWSRLPVPCRCGTMWLFVARQSGSVMCAYPDCRLTARLEVGKFGRQLVWADGTVWQAA